MRSAIESARSESDFKALYFEQDRQLAVCKNSFDIQRTVHRDIFL